MFALEEVARQLNATGRCLILCGTREQPAKLIRHSELEEMIGSDNICENVHEALRRAEEVFESVETKAAISGI
jgi:MFS superfamily sulfate permease-like transporter